MKSRPDFLIVSGNGRNTGKTSFVCEVIRNISKEHPVTAIKVSPHQHMTQSRDPMLEGKGFSIREEKDKDGIKDSSRMLLSGAQRVFYIESKDEALANVLDHLLPMIDPGHAVICESGGMRKYIKPSLLLLLNEAGRAELKPSYSELLPIADATVIFNENAFNPSTKVFEFDGSKWILNTEF